MAETKLTTNGLAVTVWFALPNAFANPKNPTASEINSGAVNVTKSIAWANYSFGAQASTQNSDPGMGDVGNTQTRGFAQFGGTISFFYPKTYSDSSDESLITFLALEKPRTLGYVIIRVDGQKDSVDSPAQDGDFLRIYRVMSDGWSDVNTGEENFKYSITFQPQGDLWINAVVGTVAVATPAAIGAEDFTIGGKTPLSAFVTGRELAKVDNQYDGYPGGFDWQSSDSDVASVDANGVVHGVSAGTAEITAIHKITRVESTPLEVTIA